MHIKGTQRLGREIEMLRVVLYWWLGKVETTKRLDDSIYLSRDYIVLLTQVSHGVVFTYS
jgi:hypothetical protein